ncbi:hypothetical protein [Saccharothrix deserti]|uniref:hypothetical protein n=1 Tax=Saccharothrix deserti TaxID=2593674 RepID=UPI00131AB0EF|nr:hypothetical protein [Saccharothrix deserti]
MKDVRLLAGETESDDAIAPNRHDRISGTLGEGAAALRDEGRGSGVGSVHMGRVR